MMETLNALTAKPSSIAPGLPDKPDAALAGAFAIFETILKDAVPADIDPTSPEGEAKVAHALDLILADETVTAIIGETEHDDLLPIVTQMIAHGKPALETEGSLPRIATKTDINQDHSATDTVINSPVTAARLFTSKTTTSSQSSRIAGYD
ncbi:MAG: hypothetical protein VW665_08360, partial [Candidatus Puniceispirillum sp.]